MEKSDYAKFMRMSIQESLQSVKDGQSPFGCVIVKGGKIIARGHNVVRSSTDPTAHAEVYVIRLAAKKLKTIDLKGCTLFASCEPCPMCFAASHWANISEIVYGATIKDALSHGFRELTIEHVEFSVSGSSIKVVPEFMREEAAEAMKRWKGKPY
jgi:guanine deaminase